jgi:hypothetical protein
MPGPAKAALDDSQPLALAPAGACDVDTHAHALDPTKVGSSVVEAICGGLDAMSLVTTAVSVATLAPANVLMRRGEYWEVKYDGRTSFIEDCRGLRYIALLVRDTQGDRGPLHARELVAIATGQPSDPIELEAPDSLLDAAARADFMKRLEEIAAERARTHDETTLAALDEECDRIAEALEHAGRGRRGPGRGSTFNTAGEKARKAVGKAISEAIVRIGSCSELSALADHLAKTVRKGQWLSYSGTAPWHVEFDIARIP